MKMFLIALFVLSVGAFAQDEDDIRIMNMMNDLRREHGAKPLKFHPKLDSLAIEWVEEISDSLKNVSDSVILYENYKNPKYLHVNSRKRFLYAQLTKGIVMQSVAENVAFSSGYHQDIIKGVFNAWKKSTGHYSAIVNPSYNNFGFFLKKRKNGEIFYITVFSAVIE